ncbi:MAG: phosphate acyltransferase PlsX [Leptonema sp. (in: bacteria)]
MQYVAVDSMSGDLGPEPAIEGTVQAVKEWNIPVILVGKEEILREKLSKYKYDKDMILIENAEEVIGMEESPSKAVKTKTNASVVVCANLVKKGEAVGFFSPGNTGATMAASLFYMGRVLGVYRPCIASPIPREDGGTTILVDSGANVDSRPEWLVQFALMGDLYAREIFGISKPRIAILSNGEENHKGNVVSVQAAEKLQKLPINFIGNIEGRDLYGGTPRFADIVVCDGFVGNVVLKATEGLASTIFRILLKGIENSSLAKTGAFLLKPVLTEIKKRMDYTEYGGAPLLGVNGACVIGHGSSNAKAIKNAIRVCYDYSQKQIAKKIEDLFPKKFTIFGREF